MAAHSERELQQSDKYFIGNQRLTSRDYKEDGPAQPFSFQNSNALYFATTNQERQMQLRGEKLAEFHDNGEILPFDGHPGWSVILHPSLTIPYTDFADMRAYDLQDEISKFGETVNVSVYADVRNQEKFVAVFAHTTLSEDVLALVVQLAKPHSNETSNSSTV